jgi:phosphoesterase RecJ-like protein
MSGASDMRAVCDRLRTERLAAIAVHENPDMDAVGAAAGLIGLLSALGAQAHLHVDSDVVLPRCDFFLALGDVVTGPPPPGATLYALDSGSLERTALRLDGWQGDIVTIDHHHDSRRFGLINLVMPEASSVSEIVCLLAAELGVGFSPAAATGLYAGISFDSGHFRHATTSALTFRCAAALVEAGADPTSVYRELYEQRSLADVRLWARAVERAVACAGGQALVSVLTLADYDACGADDDSSEGVVESLRAIKGVLVAALVKEQRAGHRVRVSLRSAGWDVSSLAAEHGGGGHLQAAGFSSDDPPEEVAAWLSSVLAERLPTASS